MTTIIQTSRALLSGRAAHKHGHSIRSISVFVPNLLASQSSPSEDHKHPTQRLEWVRKGLCPGCLLSLFYKGKDGPGPPWAACPVARASHPTPNTKSLGLPQRVGENSSEAQQVLRHLTCYFPRPISPFYFHNSIILQVAFHPHLVLPFQVFSMLFCVVSLLQLKKKKDCFMAWFQMYMEQSEVACYCELNVVTWFVETKQNKTNWF